MELNARVQRDLQDMDREFQREKERKQLGVLKGLLRKAFPAEEVRRKKVKHRVVNRLWLVSKNSNRLGPSNQRTMRCMVSSLSKGRKLC